jgi:hypothetical protein
VNENEHGAEQVDENDAAPEVAPDAGERIRAAAERDEAAAAAAEAAAPAKLADEPDEVTQAIVNAQATYFERVFEAMGPAAEVRPCSACSGFGFNALELPASTSHERCADCNGWGYVRTGSRVESQETLPCETCQGNGWTRKARPIEVQPPLPPLIVPPANTAPPAPAELGYTPLR